MVEEPNNDTQASQNIKTLYRFKTKHSADSVEWCPHEPYQHFFICANYELLKDNTNTSQKRVGRILLFSISVDSGLKLWSTIRTAAVLDTKWCHSKLDGNSVVGVVNAENKLEIYKFIPEDYKLVLVTFYEIVSDSELLLLSLDWSTGKFPSEQPEIVCSDSKGSYHMFMLDNNRLILKRSCQVHKFEAWIAAFYYWDANLFFTGGDDCVLAMFDQRVGLEPTLKNKKFSAGVTCIHSNAKKEFIIAVGSYEETLQLWDIRNMKGPLKELKMPGPLWRVKWDPHSYNHLIAACMLGGAHIVSDESEDDLKLVGNYYEHKNITYGVDWCYLTETHIKPFDNAVNRIIASCSFYDHELHVSKVYF